MLQFIIAPVLAISIAAIIGALFYYFRRFSIRNSQEMKSFLDERFDVIYKESAENEPLRFIDESMVKRWGHNGWVFISLPAMMLGMLDNQIWSIGGILSITVLFFAGMLFGDSRACLYMMRQLGLDRYEKRNGEQDSAMEAPQS